MIDRITILHAVAPGAVGGIESVVRLLASGQRERGHDVQVLATVDAPDGAAPFTTALRAAGVVVHPIVARGRAYVRELRSVREALSRLAPAVVHTHGYRADVIAGLAARQSHIATVTTVHGFTGGDLKNRFYERLQRAAFRWFDAVVAVSSPLRRSLAGEGVRGERLHLIANAYASGCPPLARSEARARLGIADDHFRIGWIGRITREKGLDVAVGALAELRDHGASLSVIGDGAETTAVRAHAAALGVDSRVVWHGIVADAGALMPAFDAFLLSSRTEGTPIVLFEAMAAGVPIVATLVGGVPDVLSSLEALLAPSENVVSLAGALRSIRNDRAGAAARAHCARQRLTTVYAIEPWLDAYDRVYECARSRATARYA